MGWRKCVCSIQYDNVTLCCVVDDNTFTTKRLIVKLQINKTLCKIEPDTFRIKWIVVR